MYSDRSPTCHGEGQKNGIPRRRKSLPIDLPGIEQIEIAVLHVCFNGQAACHPGKAESVLGEASTWGDMGELQDNS